MSFDPYRKWLGIPADRRPPTYYDLLGITDGENDSDVIRNAIEQRRAFVQSKRGEGHDEQVRTILGLFEEATSTLLVPEFKDGYDRHLGLHLKGKRKSNRRSYLLPTWMESRVVRVYGEGSGIVGDLFGIVAIIFGAFALMAILSFTLQRQASKSDVTRELTWMEKAAGVVPITEVANPVKDAKEQVARIETALVKLEEVVKAAKAERNGLAVKLKGMGINSASDVKGNPLAKRTAEDIGRLSNEIESQEKKAVALASKLQQAKAILRRMELEQSGLSEQELNKLALQLHETDKTEDGWSQPINPIDIDQAVDKALAASGPVVAKTTPESPRQEANEVVTPSPANTSVENEATDGVSSGNLFDGNSFDGWRFVAAESQQNIPSLQDAWGIESARGVLFAKGVGSSWLTTKRKLGDFNLQFEWRFPPNSKISANGSGMVIRANGINETGYDPRGIEIDLSDSDRLGAFLCYDAGMSSAKGIANDSGVGLLEPISKPTRKPVGDWNTTIIESHSRELTVYINGKKVNQGKTDLLSSGEICLRSQNTAVEFRDFRFTSSRHSNESEVETVAKAAKPTQKASPSTKDQGNTEGWITMFDGKTLNGWSKGGDPSAWRVENGTIVCNGKRSHLFYDGSGAFKNFHFKCEAKCFSGSNSGVYFHTQYKEQGYPSAGFECQIDNSIERRKTGSLYGLVDVTNALAQDGKWFKLEIMVKEKLITIKIDGRVVVNYKEPNNQKPNTEFERLIGEGIFALQSNSPGFETYFRNLQVRRIED